MFAYGWREGQSYKEIDAAIIGGGPAGAAVATLLARRGHRCAIFEKAKFPRYHIGESLIPGTYGALERLGLLSKLKSSNYPVKHSVRFVSEAGDRSTPFYFSETIEGEAARTWQVERSTFDQLMLDHAQASGVAVCQSAAVNSVMFEGDRAVGVRLFGASGEDESTVRSRVVVDASGHATLLGRQLSLRRDVPGLNKASIWGYWRGGKRAAGIDAGETTVFAIPGGGWFWYIPLPDQIVSVGVVADPKLLLDPTVSPEQVYDREARRCATMWERLSEADRVGPVRWAPRLAYMNSRTCGDGWVMIGDARAFLDPIYSSGLFLALASAELAADCIDDALKANDLSAARLGKFEPALLAGVDVIRRLIHAFYDPQFSFGEFARRYPQHRHALVDCLVGDVLKDMSQFTEALEEMTPAPPPLG